MYFKNCPVCNALQEYMWKISFDKAIKNNSICPSCSQRKASLLKPQCQKGFKNIKNIGKNNPMYGISIYDLWIKKYGDIEGNKLIEQHKARAKKNNKSKERIGIPLIDIFKIKYGDIEGELRYNNWLASQKTSGLKGKDNPAYGKPAHKLAGRGIKGYLDGIFFRSLLEMQYIYYRMENGDKISGAEKLKYRTSYVDENGKNKTYHPDFLINDKIIIEIKPTKFLERNKEKINAGENRFKENYIVETENTFPFLIDKNKAKELLESSRLSFIKCDIARALKNINRLKYIKRK